MRNDINCEIHNERNRLTKMTNEELCALIHSGDEFAKEALIEKNQNLVYKTALMNFRKYRQESLTVEDLYQEGCIGLLVAAEKFNVSKECKLSTYASFWINQRMTRAIQETGNSVRLPVYMHARLTKVYNLQKENPNASISELSEMMEDVGCMMNEEKFRELISLSEHYYSCASLNENVGEDDTSELMDFIAGSDETKIEDELMHKDLCERIHSALSRLSIKEAEVLRMRFGLSGYKIHTLDEIGRMNGVSRERVRQIETKAMKKLREPSWGDGLRMCYEGA